MAKHIKAACAAAPPPAPPPPAEFPLPTDPRLDSSPALEAAEAEDTEVRHPVVVHHHHYDQSMHIKLGQGAVLAGAGAAVAVDSAVAVGPYAAAAQFQAPPPACRATHGRVPLPITAPVEVTAEARREVLARIGAEAADYASRNPEWTWRYFIEFLEDIHMRREEHRSLRQCAAWGDKLEVMSPNARWVTTTFNQGLGFAYDQIVEGLASGWLEDDDPADRRVAEGAYRLYADNPLAVIAATPRSRVVEHLQSLAALGGQEGEKEMPHLPRPRDSRNPRYFDSPGFSRVDLARLGNECMQRAADHLSGRATSRESCFAMIQAAVQAVYQDPDNATVFALPEGGYSTWTAYGWLIQEAPVVTTELFGQGVATLDLALRQILTQTPDGKALLLIGNDESRAPSQDGAPPASLRGLVAEGPTKAAGGGAPPSGPDPELARVHPRPHTAARPARPVRLTGEVEAQLYRDFPASVSATAGELASAIDAVRRKACSLIAEAQQLLEEEDWEVLRLQVCESTWAFARESTRPCHEELRNKLNVGRKALTKGTGGS